MEFEPEQITAPQEEGALTRNERKLQKKVMLTGTDHDLRLSKTFRNTELADIGLF